MSTLNAILKEIKDIPVSRLEELYQFVHSMTPTTKHSESSRKKILSFGGAFSDMSRENYSDFLNQTKKARSKLIDRNFEMKPIQVINSFHQLISYTHCSIFVEPQSVLTGIY